MPKTKILTKNFLNFSLNLRLGNRIKDESPCEIVLQANNSTSVESVFHRASRKGAKDAKCGEVGKYDSLRALRLGAINLVKWL